ncbi:MAG: hypothetical protein QG553_168 [Patescibacteria group bacterium]|nr:hypothetical protein [Patescibacteria group bacterium]
MLLSTLTRFAAEQPALDCAADKAKTFFGLPVWYKYLNMETVNKDGVSVCKVNIDFAQNPSDVWAIMLGIIDILLRVGGIAAVIYVIYGGFLYMTSQGEPDRTKQAKETIIGAIIGLVIVMMATQIVSFIGNRL